MRKKMTALAVIAVLLLSFVPKASAHEYDRDDSDMWIRYFAYPAYAFGILVEYAVARPAHFIVSQPHLNILFGHEVTEDVTYDYFEWQ